MLTVSVNSVLGMSVAQFAFLITTPEWRFFLLMYMMYNNGGIWSDEDCPKYLPATCGDGLVYTWAGEECDEGDTASGDGCSATCRQV